VETGDLFTSTELVDGTNVVSVTGEVDLMSSSKLRRELGRAIDESGTIAVDFAGLTFIDSSGLSALVDAHRRARDAGGVLILRHPTPMLRRLLDITRLETLLTIDPPEPGPAESGGQA
jgi:anti-sigma B factor antagonist